MTEETTHAILAPSAADRWMTCLGSVALTKGMPDSSSAYADEGTDYHYLAALCLEDGSDAMEYVGRPLPLGTIVTEDNAQSLQAGYLDPVRAYSALGTLLVEEKLPLQWYTQNPKDTGTSDAVIIGVGYELIVADLKFGRGVEVAVEDNRQCQIYALGVIEKHGLGDDYETVRLVICQPRTGDGKPKEWVTSMTDLLAFKETVQAEAKRIAYAEATMTALPLVPSEKACRFCKAKGVCPALAKLVDDTMLDGFTVGDAPAAVAEVLKRDAMILNPTDPGEVLGRKMDRVDLIELFLQGVRSAVEIELLAGRPVVGKDGAYGLVIGKKGNRKWQSEEAVETLFKSFRLKTEEMYDLSLISPTTAEKRLAKEHPKRWTKTQEFITQADGKLSVAGPLDKRPRVTMTKPEDGFVDDGADLF